MGKYTLDKYDFKRYLLEELPETRQEELIFWKRNIPMPVDIIYTMFEKRGVLFASYLDHFGAAYLYAFIKKEQQAGDWKETPKQAPSEIFKNERLELVQQFSAAIQRSRIVEVLIDLADSFMLTNYVPNATRLADAMCHQGKKYERLYIPAEIKKKIAAFFPELREILGRSKSDMFSNIVADELGIYRMGFADAFSGLFNKLIDFVLDLSGKGITGSVSTAHTSLIQDKSDAAHSRESQYGYLADGSVWAPHYQNAASSFIINERHPFSAFFKKGNKTNEEVLFELIAAMAEAESELIRDEDKEMLEFFRQKVSRKLRIRMEELL